MKILMHTCCAPCLEYPSKILQEEGIEYVAYFYNPNIQPYWEHERRKKALEELSEMKNFKLVLSTPEENKLIEESLINEAIWKEQNDLKRCEFCYRTRLDNVARYAKENSYEYFSTTLLLSIYQNHDLIKRVGNEIAEKYSIKFYERDFRNGFRESQYMAKNDHLYRQKHCGCILSLYKSALKDKIIGNAPRDWISAL